MLLSLNCMLFQSPAVAQKVRLRHFVANAWLRCQGYFRVICGGHTGPRTGFPPRTSSFPCQHHFTNAPYYFITFVCYGRSTFTPIKHVSRYSTYENIHYYRILTKYLPLLYVPQVISNIILQKLSGMD